MNLHLSILNQMQSKLACCTLKKLLILFIKSLDLIKVKKIILDPVMVAKGGSKLIDDKAVLLLKKKIDEKSELNYPKYS